MIAVKSELLSALPEPAHRTGLSDFGISASGWTADGEPTTAPCSFASTPARARPALLTSSFHARQNRRDGADPSGRAGSSKVSPSGGALIVRFIADHAAGRGLVGRDQLAPSFFSRNARPCRV